MLNESSFISIEFPRTNFRIRFHYASTYFHSQYMQSYDKNMYNCENFHLYFEIFCKIFVGKLMKEKFQYFVATMSSLIRTGKFQGLQGRRDRPALGLVWILFLSRKFAKNFIFYLSLLPIFQFDFRWANYLFLKEHFGTKIIDG